MTAMPAAPKPLHATEHASAVARLAAARVEQGRLGDVLTAAVGPRATGLAETGVSAGHADVAAREEWLNWVDEGESLEPWADGDWAPGLRAGPHLGTAGVAHELRIIRERIGRGEEDLIRAVEATGARITELNRLAASVATAERGADDA
jgi:hypothetical protein